MQRWIAGHVTAILDVILVDIKYQLVALLVTGGAEITRQNCFAAQIQFIGLCILKHYVFI